MAIPNCPICGAPMQKKTARKGKNAGHEFWGCSQWKTTRCSGTIDASDGQTTNSQYDGTHPNQGYIHQDIYADKISREFEARGFRQGYTPHFYQCRGITKPLLDHIARNPRKRKELIRFTGWRVDLPDRGIAEHSELQLRVISGVLKIILRGVITLVSPYVDGALKEYYGNPVLDTSSDDYSFLFYKEQNPENNDYWLDGYGAEPPEREFYNKVLPAVLSNFEPYVTPQVYLKSLISEDDMNSGQQERVDFFLSDGVSSLIIEIDDISHQGHENRDTARSLLAQNCGFPTWRITSDDLKKDFATVCSELRSRLSELKPIAESKDKYSKLLKTAQMIHQLEISILLALSQGLADAAEASFQFDYESWGLDEDEADFICRTTETDINQMLNAYLTLYTDEQVIDVSLSIWDGSEPSDPGLPGLNILNPIIITQDDSITAHSPLIYLRNAFLPYNISMFFPSDNNHLDMIPDRSVVRYFLELIFRKSDFMEGQYETIERALQKKDTVVLLPTGGGKSISFQLTALLMPGVSLVISPIVSLMDDQVDNLQRAGIDRVISINSQIKNPGTRAKLIKAFGRQEFLLAYISPERMQTEAFRGVLKTLTMYSTIPLVAIDEAHCVSEWGHDFRTSYLNIGRTSREFCSNACGSPCILALTGTASSAVLKDVQRELQIPGIDTVITPRSFDRVELNYHIKHCDSKEKELVLNTILEKGLPADFGVSKTTLFHNQGEQAFCGIIFCPHINGPYGIDNVRQVVNSINIDAQIYGGQAPKGLPEEKWNVMKKEVADNFKNDNFTLLATTKAFGMGIDKPNIRYTIHYGLPPSIEAYYQEVGRAGRNRQKAHCYMIASIENEFGYDELFNFTSNHSELDLKQSGSGDDVSRVLFFHSKAFVGINEELEFIKQTLEELAIKNTGRQGEKKFKVEKDKRNNYEKALHRLVLLGVLSDYTIDYANNEFTVKISGCGYDEIVEHYREYVAGYNVNRVPKEIERMKLIKRTTYQAFIISACGILIGFIYDTIEKGRRRALKEMYLLAKEAEQSDKPGDKIRQRILRYLESTFSEEIELILSSEDLGFETIRKLMDGYENELGEMVGGLRSHSDATEIRGQVSRYLESIPDHPGLLFLRSLSEVYCPTYDADTVKSNFLAGIQSIKENYNVDDGSLRDFIVWALSKLDVRDNDICEACIVDIIKIYDDIWMSSMIIKHEHFNPLTTYFPMVHFMSHLATIAVEKYNLNRNN